MKIIFDLDSTLCGFSEAWIDWMYENGVTDILSNSSIKEYNWVQEKYGDWTRDFWMKDPFDTYARIKPIRGAKELISWCRFNDFEFEILTHACHDATREAKKDFCQRYFDTTENEFRTFEVLEDKYKSIGKGLLIDDYPLHCLYHLLHNESPAVIFNLDNSYGWSRISNYRNMVTDLSIDITHLQTASSYPEVKDYIRKYCMVNA